METTFILPERIYPWREGIFSFYDYVEKMDEEPSEEEWDDAEAHYEQRLHEIITEKLQEACHFDVCVYKEDGTSGIVLSTTISPADMLEIVYHNPDILTYTEGYYFEDYLSAAVEYFVGNYWDDFLEEILEEL